ncbi:hypothetical protein ACFVAJ_18980 [Agromyces sp. NPDC057679]|uniref:hypothetical protein n=1 Tax=Agromyces sp. NPDC057679 TaxID=3346207 RepID=UPI00366B015B
MQNTVETVEPITAKLRKETWVNDNAVETGIVIFDIRPLLDTQPLGRINVGDDYDWLVEEAFHRSVLDRWDGPYTLTFEDDDEELRAYVDARRAAGQIDPIAGEIRRDEQSIAADLNSIGEQINRLLMLEHNLSRQGVAAVTLRRWPEATDVELGYVNDSDRIQVLAVTDKDGRRLYSRLGTDADGYAEEVYDYVSVLDSFGIEAFIRTNRDGFRVYGFTI